MPTEPVLLREYLAQRAADERFEDERDRRYAEVAQEREKALKIKETADLAALELAREIQTYKDEKANELRSQIESERGMYVTQGDLKGAVEKIEAQMVPVAEYVTSTRGSYLGQGRLAAIVTGTFGLLLVLVSLVLVVSDVLTP